MIPTKHYPISILLFFCFFQIKGQSVAPDCTKDSAEYITIRNYLDTCNNNYIDLLLYKNILKNRSRDRLCDVIIYAQIFNSLLERGLNLNYNYAQDPPDRITKDDIDMDPALQSKVENVNNIRLQYHIHGHFLRYKEHFERSVLPKYEGATDVFEKDVKTVITFGALAYPSVVYDMLFFKK